MLALTLEGKENIYTSHKVRRFAEQCNQRKNASKDAQDASQKLFLCALLSKIEQEQGGNIVAEAYVSIVGTRSIDVIIPKYGIEGKVWIEDSVALGHILGVDFDPVESILNIHWNSNNEIQPIKVFDCVSISIKTEMTSPPRYKLYLEK
jgi:exoribonuclease R